MLIFGDLATKKVNISHEVNIIEIIYEDLAEKQYIRDKYGLSNITFNSEHHQCYRKEDLIYKLYSKDLGMILRKILKDCFSKKFNVTIANPFINFIFDTLQVVTYHARLDDWIDRMNSYSFLADTYIKDLVDLDPNYDNIIQKYHNLLKPLVKCQTRVSTRPYVYHDFDKEFTRSKLLSIVTTSVVNRSPYYMIRDSFPTKEEEYLNEKKFNNLTYHEKVVACIESLYIDVLNEFVIPHIKQSKMQPDDKEVYRFFIRAIMCRTSQTNMTWFSHFMLNNFNQITDDYEIGFYNVFKNVLREGELIIT